MVAQRTQPLKQAPSKVSFLTDLQEYTLLELGINRQKSQQDSCSAIAGKDRSPCFSQVLVAGIHLQ
jgi:hypothetical protein